MVGMAKKKSVTGLDRVRLMDNLRVVLVGARNPLNIGAAARAMSNFGVRRLRVVNPYEVAFREARSAVGAADLLAKAARRSRIADWWWARAQWDRENCSIL